MNDTPTKSLSDADRAALFASWLKPLAPAKSPRDLIVEKLTPWRQFFVQAHAKGYGWDQLAKDVATKPEIGLKLSGHFLRDCLADACRLAGEVEIANGLKPATAHRRKHRRTRPIDTPKANGTSAKA